MGELARKLANTIVKWDDIRALMCNRLIALDKCPEYNNRRWRRTKKNIR